MKNIFFLSVLILSCGIESKNKDHFENGFEKHENGDFYGAIVDYTKAIELDPNLALAYSNRGSTKYDLGDYTVEL